MEDSQVAEQLPSDTDREVMTLGEWLDKLCVYYMTMGVTYEEFWYGDYTKFKYVARQYDAQRKLQNEDAWLQGAYVYDAVATALSNAFRKKGAKAQNYLERPLQVYPKTEEEERYEAEMERRKIIKRLNAWKAAWDAKERKEKIAKERTVSEGVTPTETDIPHGSS